MVYFSQGRSVHFICMDSCTVMCAQRGPECVCGVISSLWKIPWALLWLGKPRCTEIPGLGSRAGKLERTDYYSHQGCVVGRMGLQVAHSSCPWNRQTKVTTSNNKTAR